MERDAGSAEVGVGELRLGPAADGLEAAFVPEAGMVGVSLRDGDDELLGQRHGLDAYVREGRTMGIPLLHPWANRLAVDRFEVGGQVVDLGSSGGLTHRDEHGLPIHGLLAGWRGWQVVNRSAGRGGAELSARLDLGADPMLMAVFPFPHRLRLDIELRGRALAIRTTLAATGERPVPVAFGFHPYLRLAGAPRESFEVELPAMRRVEVDDRGIPTGETRPLPARSEPLGSAPYDEGFVDVERGAELAVSGAGRRIAVTLDEGYPAAQVFAPTDEPVICFEPMTAPTNALVSGDRLRFVAPGEIHTARFTISVEREA